MARASILIEVDASHLERVLDEHAARVRALLEQPSHESRAAVVLGALAIAGASRRVSRRELLGLGWLRRRPTGGGSKSLAVTDGADRAAGHFARVQQMKTP